MLEKVTKEPVDSAEHLEGTARALPALERPRASRRPIAWLSHRPFVALTYAVLLTALGFVVAAALPSAGRALGWTEVRTVSRSSLRGTSAEQAGLEAMHEKERSLGDDGEDELDPRFGARGASVRVKTQVFETPGKAALGTLPSGAIVRVLGEREGFYHVLYEDQGEAEIGWVKKADLLFREEPPVNVGRKR
jgi:hypothetical protein